MAGITSSCSEVRASGTVTKLAWPGARRPPSPTLSPGYFHRVSPPYKEAQGPSGEEGRWGEGGVGLCLRVKVSQMLYLPSWGQLNFSDHLLLHKGSTPERPTVEWKWHSPRHGHITLCFSVGGRYMLYVGRVGYGIKTGPHNLLFHSEGERELESMDVLTFWHLLSANHGSNVGDISGNSREVTLTLRRSQSTGKDRQVSFCLQNKSNKTKLHTNVHSSII